LGRSFLLPPVAAAGIAIICALAGIRLVSGYRTRILVPLSGLVLMGVAVFGLIPEVVREIGWLVGLPLVAVGFCALALLERLEEKIAGSLVAATALHAFVDGWGMIAVASHRTPIPKALSTAVVIAILIHKAPEGLALGAMLRAAAPRFAIPLAVAAELATVLGGAAGRLTAPPAWVDYPLALAAGAFLFLGMHAQRAAQHAARHAPGGVVCADGETVAKHPGH
jgi:zinc transporter ZupT